MQVGYRQPTWHLDEQSVMSLKEMPSRESANRKLLPYAGLCSQKERRATVVMEQSRAGPSVSGDVPMLRS